MGKIHLKHFIVTVATLLISLSVPISAHAQQCTSTVTNPAAGSATTILAYGVARKAGRNHHGVDIMLEMCLPVQNQPGCQIILNNTNASPLWRQGGETSGYGFFTRYKCGPRVEIRYAHLNGYSANSNMVINGKSGASRATDPHIHYEVIVYNESGGDGIKVDPQCVWGAHPDQPKCCINVGGLCSLGVEPADMCDNTVLNNLRSNAKSSRTQGLKPTGATYTDTFNNGNTINPENVPPGDYGEDLPGCEDPGTTEHVNHSDEGLEDGPITNVGTEVIPGTSDPDVEPPPINPSPPIPGTPGGDPNLVPSPDPADAPDKLSGCAADTWTAMVNQAVMETRREDLLNKRFIVKSQSVLNYSCFGEQYKRTAELVAPIFSETEKWNDLSVDLIGKQIKIELQVQEEENDPFFSEKDYNFWRDYEQSNGTTAPYKRFESSSLDMAIDSVVAKASIPYLENNFNHGYLADSVPVSGADPTTCNVMSTVWKAAKCKNFDGADVFYSFEDLATNDPREFPVSMPCF